MIFISVGSWIEMDQNPSQSRMLNDESTNDLTRKQEVRAMHSHHFMSVTYLGGHGSGLGMGSGEGTVSKRLNLLLRHVIIAVDRRLAFIILW